MDTQLFGRKMGMRDPAESQQWVSLMNNFLALEIDVRPWKTKVGSLQE